MACFDECNGEIKGRLTTAAPYITGSGSEVPRDVISNKERRSLYTD